MNAISTAACAILSFVLVAGSPVAIAGGTKTPGTAPNGHAHSGKYKVGQSRQAVAKQCKQEAADNHLTGEDRKAFINNCTGGQAQSVGAGSTLRRD